MANSRDILLKLVRIAIGWENDFSLPADVDWKAVLSLAHEQGVNAIAVDGLEKWMTVEPHLLSSPKEKQLLLEAIGSLQMVEVNNLHQLSALVKLSQILSKKEIPFMIMKGFACAQYYPNPKHRPCGDIDIYPGNLFEESNQALKDAGVSVDPYYYRHSASYIDGVMIENHKILGDLRGPKKQTRELEEWLKREAAMSFGGVTGVNVFGKNIPGAIFPSANFNSLFLPWHVSAHFMFEKVTLRHLLDWALFLTRDGKEINVDLFKNAKKSFTYGYSKVVDILTNLSIRYLYMPVGDIPSDIIQDAVNFNIRLSDKIFDYMFEGKPRERDDNVWKFRWNNMKRIWKERWKYSEVFNMSTLGFLYLKVYGVIFKVGE